MPVCPNYIPNISSSSRRIAIIGEAPGETEATEGKPFVGMSGQLLRGLLSKCGVNASDCFFGNVCQVRPPRNDISQFDWEGQEIQTGLRQLDADLHKFKPTIIICVGASAVRGMLGNYPSAAITKKGNFSITMWRGSPAYVKRHACWCVSTFHPAYLLRSFEQTFLTLFDLHKALRINDTTNYSLPSRTIHYKPTADECVDFLAGLRRDQLLTAFDIEGGVEKAGIKCISFCNNANEILTVPFRDGAKFINGNYFKNIEDEMRVWRAVAQILMDPRVPKLAHNAYYELFVMLWNHAIVCKNLRHDTMQMFWELMCETAKDLGTVASIFTDEPYYKSEREVDDDDTHRIYCGKDSGVTLESAEKMLPSLEARPESNGHYHFNMEVMIPYVYMTTRGCRADENARRKHFEKAVQDISQQQTDLNKAVGGVLNPKSNDHKKAWLFGELKPPSDKPSDAYKAAAYLASISAGFKIKKDRDGKISADEATLDKLYIDTNDERLFELIKLIHKRTFFSDIQKLLPFPDGRYRSDFTACGPKTARSASQATTVMDTVLKAQIVVNNDGSISVKTKRDKQYRGTNLQNQTKELRNCFVPDPGFDFFQYDLAGADAWTVACDLKALGYPQMFDHLMKGIKPSKNIVLAMHYGLGVVKDWTDDDWLAHQHEVDGEDIMYLCSKRVQHGTNYGMKVPLMREVILKDSVKRMSYKGEGEPIWLDLHRGNKLQQLYLALYGGANRQKWINEQLSKGGYLDGANGHRRKFLSIRDKFRIPAETIREALSHEPQGNTTYITNRALHNMFYDPENRRPNGSLKVEPLLTIHDALAGQWPQEIRDWAIEKVREWFRIPMTIHGIDVTIPADGGWGTSWKDLPNEL